MGASGEREALLLSATRRRFIVTIDVVGDAGSHAYGSYRDILGMYWRIC